ncbi:sucrose phosphorylase [uncultured Sphaerochaeta sp.]|uniref:sucrose phosphorylase n=1 Tax=uncultured Sphaerochaeta sp. TaxID=886478 RepID=UPI002A0A3C47|nr:sucrose phosphorylase [uncultured Sphaerochaeta sp.]
MTIRNQIMLITYPDSMGKNLKELYEILDKHFQGIIGGLHILPFFPSSADRGFAPTSYEIVDSAFGDWNDIKVLSDRYYLMVDFMINHISTDSLYFQDFLLNKEQSVYKDLFLRYKDFWPNKEPTQHDIDLIYKRKPRAPYLDVTFHDGTTEKVWCTFSDEQVDLAVSTQTTKAFICDTLQKLSDHGASIIRLDAFAYAIKKLGTNCFFVEPETFELLNYCQSIVKDKNVCILPEIHEHYSIQMKLADRGYWVYDFALPLLLLNALYTGKNKNLVNWLKICPRKQFTTLDTHDGIGVADVKGLMTQQEIDQTTEFLFSKGANVKRIYNTSVYNNLDVYQLNCTYYSALGDDDDAYLLARAIQFFAPGIPQIYYVGLLAGKNDITLLEKTKVGRDINRHYYSKKEVEREIERPLLCKMYQIMKFRNSFPAFDGDITIENTNKENELEIKWVKGKSTAVLQADLKTYFFKILYSSDGEAEKELILSC